MLAYPPTGGVNPRIVPKKPEASPSAPEILDAEAQNKTSHALALEGLTLAVQTNMERLQAAEKNLLDARKQRVMSLRALKRRRVRQTLLGRKRESITPEIREIVSDHRAQRDEIEIEIDTCLRNIDEFRARFSQQVEDTVLSGFTDLSEEWTKEFLALNTPFEEEPEATPEKVRNPQTPRRRAMASVWRNIRAGIRCAIESGERVVPTFANHMQRFEHEVQDILFTPSKKSMEYAGN